MRHLASVVLVFVATTVLAQPRTVVRESELKRKSSTGPNEALAGEISRRSEESSKAAPALSYDQFRLGVELQVAEKRRQQIQDLKKIIELSDKDPKEMPSLLFRLGELYWEESKYFFFEANRKDDDLIRAMNAKDEAAQEAAKAAKAELIEQSRGYAKRATDNYSEIVQRYKDFNRLDEVLYFLGQNLLELGDDKKAMVAFRRLIEKHPKSKFIPDAYLAFGEYYFNTSKGKRDLLEKALESYKKAAEFPDNQVYGYALYKQGWCYFNLGEYVKAMDMYKSVVLYGEIVGAKAAESGGKRGNRTGLIKEARNDFVRAYSRSGGNPTDARAEFAKLAKNPEDRFTMMKQLANLYYEDGKDRDAAVTYNMLIKEKPVSPEAPGFQGKIINCVLRTGNKKLTVEQVRRLVKIMDDVKKANTIRDEKDKKALEEARELSERTISNLAVNWHAEARKTKDPETFGFSNDVYSDYLTLFPDNKKAYEMRFYWAELLSEPQVERFDKSAEEYTKVFVQDIERTKQSSADGEPSKPGKFMTSAAYNAVFAYDMWIKQLTAKNGIKPPPAASTKKSEFAPPRKSLLEACERYVANLPQGEKRVEISFKAAKLYYDHNHLDEAIERFSQIALTYPDYKFESGDRAGEVAANLVLDSYSLLEDWAKLNEWARKFYENEALAPRGPFREELKKIIEKSAFKLVSQFESKGDFGKAAEAYVNFVSEFPKSEIADQALFNAAIDFFKAKQLNKAIEMRMRLVKDYPKSDFVAQTLYDLAEGYEAIARFEESADYYEDYVRAYLKATGAKPKVASSRKRASGKKKEAETVKPNDSSKKATGWDENKAQTALFNAGIFRDGLGQYKQALSNRLKYLELWPSSQEAELVVLSIVDLHERNGAFNKAIKQLEEFESEYAKKDANKMLMAEGKIAKIYATKMRSASNARRIYERIMKYHDGLRGKRDLNEAALDAVGRAHYELSDEDFRQYKSIRLRWSALNRLAELKGTIQDKARALEVVQKRYAKTVAFRSADPAICALDRIGQAYAIFAEALSKPPIPKGMTDDLLFEFRTQMEQQAQPAKDKAAEAYLAVVQKSQELDVFNECTVHALSQLRETFKPEQFPKMQEEMVPLKTDRIAQTLGEGLLKELQGAPNPEPTKTEPRRAAGRDEAKPAPSKRSKVGGSEEPVDEPN